MTVKEKRGQISFILLVSLYLITPLISLFPGHAFSKDLNMYVPIGTGNFGSLVIRPNVKSLKTIKSTNIIQQKLDFSCGSAVTATIFKYYLNLDVNEEKIINGLFNVGNLEKIMKRKGFSLLDIKKLALALGYKAKGFKTDLKGLVKFQKPAIVAITIGSYKHYVIFKGIYKGRVFLADPAFGNTVVSIKDFKNMWYKNIALIIYPKNNYNKNFEKISSQEKIWVNEENLRKSIFYRIYPIYNSFNEFR